MMTLDEMKIQIALGSLNVEQIALTIVFEPKTHPFNELIFNNLNALIIVRKILKDFYIDSVPGPIIDYEIPRKVGGTLFRKCSILYVYKALDIIGWANTGHIVRKGPIELND